MRFEDLEKKYKLSVNEEGKVLIKPRDQYNFTTYPVSKYDCIEITKNEYIGIIERRYMFNAQLDGVVEYVEP